MKDPIEELATLTSAISEAFIYVGDVCDGMESASNLISKFDVTVLNSEQRTVLNGLSQLIARIQKNAHLAQEALDVPE